MGGANKGTCVSVKNKERTNTRLWDFMHLFPQTNAFGTVAIHTGKVLLNRSLHSVLFFVGSRTADKDTVGISGKHRSGPKREESVTLLSVKLTLVIVLLLSRFLTEQKNIKSHISISQSARKSRATFSRNFQSTCEQFPNSKLRKKQAY